MDIPIKLKACEKAAIKALNDSAPKLYQEKNPGFRWAANQAAKAKNINWEDVSKIQFDDQPGTEDFEDDDSSISHLSIEDSDFKKLLKDMNESLGTTRGVQKAFLARSVIKWGLDFKKRTSRLNAYYEAMQKTTAELSKRVVGKMASDMSMDEFRNLNTDDKLTEIYRQLQEISRRL